MKYFRQYYLAKASNVAYLKMPKCACTSIKIAVGKMRFGPRLQAPKSVHHIVNYPALFGGVVRDYDPILDSIFKFTFVRDPIQRTYSFYKNKIAEYDAAVSPFYFKLGFNKEDSFDTFVDKLISIDQNKLEEHLKPQIEFVFDEDGFKVDYIGKIENIEDDWNYIKKISGFDIDLGITNKTKDKSKTVISMEVEQKIINYYKKDCEFFGYHVEHDAVVTELLSKSKSNIRFLYSELEFNEKYRMQNQLIENIQINLSQLKEQVASTNKMLSKSIAERDNASIFKRIINRVFKNI